MPTMYGTGGGLGAGCWGAAGHGCSGLHDTLTFSCWSQSGGGRNAVQSKLHLIRLLFPESRLPVFLFHILISCK